MEAMLTHVCRKEPTLKFTTKSCADLRAQALEMGPDDAALMGCGKCLGCEGPLPLDKPVSVEVQGPGQKGARWTATAAFPPRRAEPHPPRTKEPAGPQPQPEQPMPSGARGVPQNRRPAPSPRAGGPTTKTGRKAMTKANKNDKCPECGKPKMIARDGRTMHLCQDCLRKQGQRFHSPEAQAKRAETRQRNKEAKKERLKEQARAEVQAEMNLAMVQQAYQARVYLLGTLNDEEPDIQALGSSARELIIALDMCGRAGAIPGWGSA